MNLPAARTFRILKSPAVIASPRRGEAIQSRGIYGAGLLRVEVLAPVKSAPSMPKAMPSDGLSLAMTAFPDDSPALPPSLTHKPARPDKSQPPLDNLILHTLSFIFYLLTLDTRHRYLIRYSCVIDALRAGFKAVLKLSLKTT
jgi:hypothetical protein